MKSLPPLKTPLLGLLVLALFIGCAIPDNTAEMWTNQPELAAYAEEFNARQDAFRVKVVYRENPGTDLLTAPVVPDLVLAPGLNSVRFNAILSDLSSLFDPEKGSLRKEEFYKDLLSLGQKMEQQLTLPVSFNLPALYHTETALPEGDHFTLVNREELLELNRIFNEGSTDSFPTMGFSPRWNGHYLFSQAVLEGVNFQENESGNLAWNGAPLDRIRTTTMDWIEKANGGFDKERVFTEKYLYQPGFKLIQNGRVLFQSATVKEFYSFPTQERQNLRLLWISGDEKIPVCSDVLFAGIPRQGEDKAAARAFLSWFFQQKTQAGLLESSQFKRIRGFGIAQGLSSLIRVNELDLPRFYPLLIGNIPSEANLLFPPVLPVEWEAVRREVIIPWLLADSSPHGAEASLEKTLEEWYLQNPALRH